VQKFYFLQPWVFRLGLRLVNFRKLKYEQRFTYCKVGNLTPQGGLRFGPCSWSSDACSGRVQFNNVRGEDGTCDWILLVKYLKGH